MEKQKTVNNKKSFVYENFCVSWPKFNTELALIIKTGMTES